MVNFPDVVEAGELGGLVGLAGDGALEIGVGDILGEAAGDRFGIGGRNDPAPAIVGVRGFENGAGEAGENLEVFQVATHAGADLEFVRLIGGAGERIETVSSEEPHVWNKEIEEESRG